jgi:hypothetical protein
MPTRPGLVATVALLASACSAPPPPQQVDRLVHLTHWGDAPETDTRYREIYYYTPQGTQLHGLRYEWFLNLELPFSDQRLADPAYLSRFGFLLDPRQEATPANPGNLPVGFTSHANQEKGALLDISCAACHTGQLDIVRDGVRIGLRVDGGQALHAFPSAAPGQFAPSLVTSLLYTYLNPFEFDRFAERVLDVRYPEGKAELREHLLDTLSGFLVEGWNAVTRGLYPTEEGYGRTDALGRIANTVLGDELDFDNYRIANAPVNYPHLWDIWKFDWVQWNGSAAQPMGRNVGEALGVKAVVDLVGPDGKALPASERYASSVLIREQNCIETTLWWLRPPVWDEKLLPPIVSEKAKAGKALFELHCRECHGPWPYPYAYCDRHNRRYPYALCEREARASGEPRPERRVERAPTPEKPVEWHLTMMPTTSIGTDPTAANNFLDYRYDASPLDPSLPNLKDVRSGIALILVTKKVIDRQYQSMGLDAAQRSEMDGFGRKLGVREQRAYKARPLHGIWATPPFLHNGSVPTLHDLLLPEEQRPKTFYVGSRLFDPVKVGYQTGKHDGGFLFDTSLPGNANTGHQFRNDGGAGVIGPELSDAERYQIIEYLKVMGNPKPRYAWATEADPVIRNFLDEYKPTCPPDIQGPASAVVHLAAGGDNQPHDLPAADQESE